MDDRRRACPARPSSRSGSEFKGSLTRAPLNLLLARGLEGGPPKPPLGSGGRASPEPGGESGVAKGWNGAVEGPPVAVRKRVRREVKGASSVLDPRGVAVMRDSVEEGNGTGGSGSEGGGPRRPEFWSRLLLLIKESRLRGESASQPEIVQGVGKEGSQRPLEGEGCRGRSARRDYEMVVWRMRKPEVHPGVEIDRQNTCTRPIEPFQSTHLAVRASGRVGGGRRERPVLYARPLAQIPCGRRADRCLARTSAQPG